MSHAHTSSHAHSHAHAHDPAGHGAPDGMDDLLDLDAQVLHGYWTAALDWLREAAAGISPARVLDLGAGTGTGALGLAARFPAAEVIAVDVTTTSLRRLRDKAAALSLAGRVATVEADLDGDWPDLGPLDLTWASMSLHHLADPGQALRTVRGITRPGGLIAVAEFPEPLRFLAEDSEGAVSDGRGPAGFEDRVIERLGAAHAEQMPTLGSAWAPRLADAGWTVIAERDFPIDLNPPSHPLAARYARAWFARLADRFTDRLDTGDQATLAALLDADGLGEHGRGDHGPHALAGHLHIRGTRTVTLASRG